MIPRFEDNLEFHAVLFGPGLPEVSVPGIVAPPGIGDPWRGHSRGHHCRMAIFGDGSLERPVRDVILEWPF